MRTPLSLTCASIFTALAPVSALAEQAEEAIVAEFRMEGASPVQAMAWRTGSDILVRPETLHALGLNAASVRTDGRVSLREVPGLHFSFLPAEQAIVISCSALCFPLQTLRPDAGDSVPLSSDTGAFLGMDLVATRVGLADTFAGAFDLGFFHASQHGGLSWTIGALGDTSVIRLDTSWVFDFPDERLRLRLGDSIAPASGAAGTAFRFGGIQFGTDYSLDPTFVRFPAPTFRGEAATPSVVELYVDGALRSREAVDAGPFEIVDPPVVVGAGVAQVVVTDALGREVRINAPFYASPRLLRAGLTEFSLIAGAERDDYAVRSGEYGRAFLLGAYRRGLTNWITSEARVEVSRELTAASGALSLADRRIGQLDLGVSASDGEHGEGAFASAGWSYHGAVASLSVQAETASEEYRRLGQAQSLAAREARATLALDLGRAGAVSLTGAETERYGGARFTTLGLSYAPSPGPSGSFSFSTLFVDDDRPFWSVALSFVRPLGDQRSVSAAASVDDGDLTLAARMQSNAPPSGGLGWRFALSQGAIERADAGLLLRTDDFEARLEASRVPHADGLRGQFTTAIIVIDRSVSWARGVRDSFALVDVGAPGVDVYRDHLHVGRTDTAGRLFVLGLRPYEANRISIDVDDLPLDANVANDQLSIRPPTRSGAVVRFGVGAGQGGEIFVFDGHGQPLPPGTILVRDTDLARFPVGSGGRVYLSDVHGPATLSAQGSQQCRLLVAPASLQQDEPLVCASVAST